MQTRNSVTPVETAICHAACTSVPSRDHVSIYQTQHMVVLHCHVYMSRVPRPESFEARAVQFPVLLLLPLFVVDIHLAQGYLYRMHGKHALLAGQRS